MTSKNASSAPQSRQDIPLRTIDAGEFGVWSSEANQTQINGSDANVPCFTCNGCCKSSYFIHITPEDTDALDAIPRDLLFAAPGLPKGHFVMGYNEHGHCPMLVDDRCSIYAARPQTCRAYDCRIFSAAGIEPGEMDKALVAERTRRWKFSYASDASRDQHAAVRSAASWLQLEKNSAHSKLPEGFIPSNSTQLAVLALQVHSLFNAASVRRDTTSQAFADQIVVLAPLD